MGDASQQILSDMGCNPCAPSLPPHFPAPLPSLLSFFFFFHRLILVENNLLCLKGFSGAAAGRPGCIKIPAGPASLCEHFSPETPLSLLLSSTLDSLFLPFYLLQLIRVLLPFSV